MRESLNAERDAANAEIKALRATIHKLQSQKQEPQPIPGIPEKEAEEQRRAKEKAAQEMEKLTLVRSAVEFPLFKGSIVFIVLIPKELQVLQKERECFMKEKEHLSALLLAQEQAREGRSSLCFQTFFLSLCMFF